MKKEYNKEEDPEKLIFRTALNSIEIQPSEKFWSSAFDNIIVKENAKNIRRVRLWKGVSAILGGIIVLFCLHEVVVYNKFDKVDKIESQLADMKATESKLLQNENTFIASKNIDTNQKPQVNGSSPLVSVYSEVNSRSGNASVPNVIRSGRTIAKNNSLPKSDSLSYLNNTSSGKENEAIAQKVSTGTNSIDNQNSSNLYAPIVKDTIQSNSLVSNSDTTRANMKNDTSILSLKPMKVDSISPTAIIKKQKSSINLKHKLSLSAFFAPGSTSDFLNDRDNDTTGKVSINDVKARQSNLVSYEFGLKLGYDISNKFTLSSGLYYNIYSYDINQTVLYAQEQENGAAGYSLITSSGIVNIPYNGEKPQPGDSIKVHGSSSRNYLCIPIQLSYAFASLHKFKFYANAGISANIATYQGTSLEWENTALETGNVSVQSVQGLDPIYFSYKFGLGVSYALGKGFSVYAQPSLEGTITPIDKNEPIVTYPYFFSLEFGLIYHL